MTDILEGQMGLFESPAGPANNPKEQQIKTVRKEPKRKLRPSPPPATNADTPRSKKRNAGPAPKSRSLSGLVPQGDVRLTANIREDLHLKLKIAAAQQRTTIGELIEALVERHIK